MGGFGFELAVGDEAAEQDDLVASAADGCCGW
jgi:hypothetical protein